MTNTLLSTPLPLSSSSRSIVDDNECKDKKFQSKSMKNDDMLAVVVSPTNKAIMKPKTTIIGNKESPIKKEVISKHQRIDSTVSLLLRRSVSRRVTNENTNHSFRSLQRQQQHQNHSELLVSSSESASSSTPGIHEYTMLESSYQPNEYDVIINQVNGNFQLNDSYDQYIYSILPSYVQKIHEGRYEEQCPAIQSINESIMRNGGKFLRRSTVTSSSGDNSSSWIHMSPMMARLYTCYRLKCATSQLHIGEDYTPAIVNNQHQSRNDRITCKYNCF